MNHLVISCSLAATSRSALMAEYLAGALSDLGSDVEMVDLRELELPLCDGDTAYDDDNVRLLARKIASADSVTLGVPIYNYDVGGAARNLIAMTGRAWTEKVVGFIGAAGGERSYMSMMGLANSLMLDFRSVIVPRYVYAARTAFPGGRPSEEIAGRLDALAADVHRFATAFGSLNTTRA